MKGARTEINYSTPQNGQFSLVYLPTGGEPDKRRVNDWHLAWAVPERMTGQNDKLKLSVADWNGYGLAVLETHRLNADNSFSVRANVNNDEKAHVTTGHALVKLTTPHIDAVYGLKRSPNPADVGILTQPFWYVTLNDLGRWNDTFSIGIRADGKVVNNAGLERGPFMSVSFSEYAPKTGDWSTGAYFGLGNPDKVFNSTAIDRLIPNNQTTPKTRSSVPQLPSSLTAGDYSAEIRAEQARNERFINACIGHSFNAGPFRLGLGSGIEVADGRVTPNAELLVKIPVDGYVLTALDRIRRKEGGVYFCLEKQF